MLQRSFMIYKRPFGIQNIRNRTMYANQNLVQSITMTTEKENKTKELWIYNSMSNLVKITDEDDYLEKRREFFEKVCSLQISSEQTVELCKIAEKNKRAYIDRWYIGF